MNLRIFILLFISLFTHLLYAQNKEENIRFITRGENVEEALNLWVKLYNTNLVYESSLELEKETFIDITSENPKVILTRILSNTELDYIILSTGTYVIINSKQVEENYGDFFGYVYDEETGEPLVNATIYFADARNSTITNSKGYFSVTSLLSGDYPVIFSSVGYQPISKNIQIKDSSNIQIIRLKPKLFTTDPVIIEASSISLGISKWANQTRLDENRNSFTSTNPSIDPIRILPGITSNFASHSLSIYGSDPRNMNVFLDGVRLYNAVRIGDELGMFNLLAIDKIGTSKIAGSISNEGSLNGILNYQHDVTDRLETTNHTLQINANDLNARTEFAIKNTSFAVSGRINNRLLDVPLGYDAVYKQWNQFDPLIQNFLMGETNDIAKYKAQVQGTENGYVDLHFVANSSPSTFSNTKISGYYGSRLEDAFLLSEKLSLESQQPSSVYNEEELSTTNGMINIEHFRIINASTDLLFKSSYSSSRYSYSYFMVGSNNLNTNNKDLNTLLSQFRTELKELDKTPEIQNVDDLSFSGQITKYFSSRNTLIFGLNASRLNHSLSLSDMFYLSLRNNEITYKTNAFFEQILTTSNNFRLQYGIKGSLIGDFNTIYVQPQFSISYSTEKTKIGFQHLMLSAGIYRQFTQQFDIANIGPSAIRPFNRIELPIDNTIAPPISYQLRLSWDIQYSQNSNINFETYYRNEPKNFSLNYVQLLVPSAESLNKQVKFLEVTPTTAYGASITFKKEFVQPALLLTLSQQTNISEIKYANRFGNENIQTNWSEPHSSFASLVWKYSNSLSINIQSRWIPKRYWAFTRAYYDYLTTHNELNYGDYSLTKPDEDELNPYFTLDIGLNMRFNISNSVLLLNLNLQNVTNRENEISNVLTPQRNSQQDIIYKKTSRVTAGFIPYLSLKLDF